MKNARLERPIEIVIIIRPSCLKVDKEIIFFKSYLKFAPIPARNLVNPETNSKITFKQKLKEGLKFIVVCHNFMYFLRRFDISGFDYYP